MKLLALLFVVAAATADIVAIKKCEGVEDDRCTIHEIKISPCGNKNACRLIKGEDAEITLDFTPHFSTAKLNNAVTYNTIPWDSINQDACQYTPCPVEAGKRQTYHATMHIGKKLPEGKFEFNWNIFDASNTANACCFKAAVKLIKPKK